MNVSLKPKLKKFIESQVKTGRYGSVQDVLDAAVTRLMQDDRPDDFAPAELQALVEAGERDIANGYTLTLSQVRKHFRKRLADSRHKTTRTPRQSVQH